MRPEDVFDGVIYNGDCWEWPRGRSTHGYGRVNLGEGRYDYAHRVAYREANGSIPEGMVVRHACDNPPCINPAHLSLGTQQDNSMDAVERGRIRTGRQAPAAKYTADTVEAAHVLRGKGFTYQEVADALSVPFTAVREWLGGRVR